MICPKCGRRMPNDDDALTDEIRVRVPAWMKEEFYAAVPRGKRSEVIRRLIIEHLQDLSD